MKVSDCYKTFEEGTRVRVVKNTSYKKNDYTGECGVVERNQYMPYGPIVVKLDNVKNPRGARGVFYFNPHDLEVVSDNKNDISEDNNMNDYVNFSLVQRVMAVANDVRQRYVKRTPNDIPLKPYMTIFNDNFSSPISKPLTFKLFYPINHSGYIRERTYSIPDVVSNQTLVKDISDIHEHLTSVQDILSKYYI
jgi:hypothetical protein